MHRRLTQFLLAISSSAALYLILSLSLSKPLTEQVYDQIFRLKIDAFKQSDSAPRRLLLLGGSNVRISHSAKVLSEQLHIPTTNGGISAEVSLSLIIERFKPYLKPGDIVYIPLEYNSYERGLGQGIVDNNLLRNYHVDFPEIGATAQLRSIVAFDTSYLFTGIAELAMSAAGQKSPFARDQLNTFGDQVGYTHENGIAFRPEITRIPSRSFPDSIDPNSQGMRQLSKFLTWAGQNNIRVIGGLPSTFEDHTVPASLIRQIRELYLAHGQSFLALPNQSQYPRSAFYDSDYHLEQEYQQQHSRELASALEKLLAYPSENDN